MPKTYEQIFEIRGESYNQATELCPDARKAERENLLSKLSFKQGEYLCDIPSGGGYVADGLKQIITDKGLSVICIEPSITFAKNAAKKYPYIIGDFEKIPLKNKSVNHVTSLAGIHHVSNKQSFFHEAARILKPNGYFVVADVKSGSAMDSFLNDTVHRLSDTGHEGEFLSDGELTSLLTTSGFKSIDEKLITYTWDFPDEDTMVYYCKALFGLTRCSAEEVLKEIKDKLNLTHSKNTVSLEWSLIYGIGTLP